MLNKCGCEESCLKFNNLLTTRTTTNDVKNYIVNLIKILIVDLIFILNVIFISLCVSIWNSTCFLLLSIFFHVVQMIEIQVSQRLYEQGVSLRTPKANLSLLRLHRGSNFLVPTFF